MFLLLLLPMALGQISLRGTHIKVTTVTNRPFIMRVPNLIKGERYYEGFLVDMLYKLSTVLGFTFTIHENPEGRYGGYFGGKWNGMIAEVMNGTADIALADISITAKREEPVDFTHPFLSVGLGALAYKGAAPMTLQQLADDDSVKVGAYESGSTAAAFRKSPDPLFQKIWAKMQEDPENMVISNDDGVDKVLANRGGYVYIMESARIDYEVARNCQLIQVDKMFWPHGFGLAVAPGSPYREELSQGIMRMQDSGDMEILYKKWFGLQGSQCDSKQPGLIGWISAMF